MDNCEVLSCFDNLIGIKGCHDESICKIWVNDLPGISSELVDKIADGDSETYVDVFNKAKRAAINSLKDDILDVLLRDKTRVRFNETIYNSEKARLIRPTGLETFEGKYFGVVFTTPFSKYVIAKFKGLSVYPTNNISVTKKLIDYETGAVLWQGDGAFELVPNQINNIEFDYSIDCNNLRAVFAILEAQNGQDISFSFNELSCNRFKESKCHSCDPCDAISGSGNANIDLIPYELIGFDQNDAFGIYPFNSDSMDPSLESLTAIDSFICADIDVICSIDQFICQNAERLANCLNYKIGANILQAKLGGYRCNNFAKGNLEFTKDTKDEFLKEYMKILEKTAPNLPMADVSMCWECDSQYGIYPTSLI